MHRSLVSLLSGALVVAGGWYGWQQQEVVHAAVADAVEPVTAGAGPRATPSPSGTAKGGTSSRSSTSSSSAGASSTRRSSSGNASSSTRNPTTGRSSTSRPTYDHKECTVPEPRSAAEWNTTFKAMDNFPTILGADQGASVRLADGRRMFVYGDTLRDGPTTGARWSRNMVIVADKGCLIPMKVAGNRPPIPARGDIGYWPMSIRATPYNGGTTVQVVTLRVKRVGSGESTTAGPGLATFSVATNQMPVLVSHVDLGPDDYDPRHPTWGAALTDQGGYTYLWGTASNATKSTFGWSLRVARTPTGQIAQRGAWEYWDGSAWVRDPMAARTDEAAVIPADRGVSHILSVVERGGWWYALSKEGDFVGSRMVVWKAPTPTGPFTRHDVGSLANDRRIRRYMPLAHPDAPTSSGRLLVSYSQSHAARMTYSDPSVYRPQFIEITLP